MQMDILLAYFQTICIVLMGCGAVQFLSMTKNSDHHNLTFHSSCNVLYHPSTSLITPLIWFSFIHIHSFPKPQIPSSIFSHITQNPIISHISLHKNTKWRSDNLCAKRDTKQQGVVFFLSFLQYCLTLSFYGLASLAYLYIVQLFFRVFFWYNILLFDLFYYYFFLWWWHCDRCSWKAKLDILDSLFQCIELLFNFLSFLPSFLPLYLMCFFNTQV